MFPKHLSNYVAKESQTLAEGYWILERQEAHLTSTILIVLDENECYLGSMTRSDFVKHRHFADVSSMTLGEFCNKNAKRVTYTDEYRKDTLPIFADNPNINAIPVIDGQGNLADIVFRQQAFYKEFYGKRKLPRMHYARQIYDAAALASNLGYKAFSVIEFGVAGGNGLVNCEFHAKEISRLFNIDIEVYGFDTGRGLPETDDYRDVKFFWDSGFFPMDIEMLEKRLQFANVILGDIRETGKEFISNKTFAPIGTMIIDVDAYNSTIPILNMLSDNTDAFLPRVYMYCDDVGWYLEHIGVNLAIDEFNQANNNVKISHLKGEKLGLFCAHMFRHEKYNTNPSTSAFINLI